MFPVQYSAFLKIGIPQRDNPMGLSRERYKVIACKYAFSQQISKIGEVRSSVRAGNIYLSLSDLPTDELMAWIFDHAKYYNGEVTFIDTAGETIEQLYFDEARCVDFNLHYGADTQFCAETRLTLLAQKMRIGDACFENKMRK
ncbi:MAG: hypothetical protein LBT25_02070 [Candidatus Symbiothrix sp.]|jgi:hypothetical protein|nr:hypothetical protein [Candidatus Symbiothrix sp.]